MALDIDRDTSQPRRPIAIGVVGVFVLLIAAAVYYVSLQDRTPEVAVPTTYEYKINQKVNTDVVYKSSSFYENQSPGSNTAYLAAMTDAIKSYFHYNFAGSKELDLNYTYSVKATVRALYTIGEESDAPPTVWTKEFQLVAPTVETVRAKSFAINPEVEIPYSEYKALIDQFNIAFTLSLVSEVVITSTVQVSGEVDGVSFKDTRVATVAAPLNEQLYNLAVKYDKENTGQVASTIDHSWKLSEHLMEIAAGAIAFMGLVLLVYGFRWKIFKTPYQRELDRIFRYHDGIIIRARRATNLSNKNVVRVQSFDDLLNLEEELKEPIVASPAGAEATNFIIVHDDVLYVYTLGRVLLNEESIDEVGESMEEEIEEAEANSRPKRKHVKVQ